MNVVMGTVGNEGCEISGRSFVPYGDKDGVFRAGRLSIMLDGQRGWN